MAETLDSPAAVVVAVFGVDVGVRGHFVQRGLFSLRLVVRSATLIVCLGLIAIAATLLWQARERSLNLAESTTRNLVGMLTQHTERTFDSVDLLLKIVARELGPRPDDPVKRSDLAANLAKLAQDLPHVMSVRMLDPDDGEPLFEFFRTTATGRGADADALQVHKANRYLGLHVGYPYLDHESQTWVVGVSRRISGQEGVPGRVVVALLNLEYLNSFYASIAMGEEASISIIRNDGIILTIGYLITEAETVWISLSGGRTVPGHVLGYDQ